VFWVQFVRKISFLGISGEKHFFRREISKYLISISVWIKWWKSGFENLFKKISKIFVELICFRSRSTKTWSDRLFRSRSTKTWSDRLYFDPIRSGFRNLRSDQIRSDQVFQIFDPIKFDPIRFLKSSIRWGFWNLRSDQVFEIFDPIKFDQITFSEYSIWSSSIWSGFQNLRSDQIFKIFDPIKFDPIRFFKSYADPCLGERFSFLCLEVKKFQSQWTGNEKFVLKKMS
jgi:hypothetical protein